MNNPFQELSDRLIRVESAIDRLDRKISSYPVQQIDELPVGIDKACKITGLAKPTIYSKVSRREIPGHRKAGRLYFFESELLAWIRSGKRATLDEIKADALNSIENR